MEANGHHSKLVPMWEHRPPGKPSKTNPVFIVAQAWVFGLECGQEAMWPQECRTDMDAMTTRLLSRRYTGQRDSSATLQGGSGGDRVARMVVITILVVTRITKRIQCVIKI